MAMVQGHRNCRTNKAMQSDGEEGVAKVTIQNIPPSHGIAVPFLFAYRGNIRACSRAAPVRHGKRRADAFCVHAHSSLCKILGNPFCDNYPNCVQSQGFNMKVQQRHNTLEIATTKFGWVWEEFVGGQDVTYQDCSFVLNVVDLFWISAAQSEISIAQAIENWIAAPAPTQELEQIFNFVREKLIEFIKLHSLTYAEINFVIASTRYYDARLELDSERSDD
ncbi:hypothetical protein [Pseudomonas putida]|uniref:Uncharacterized protein n=1 Tax=Pseudomonas putida TaxID=303 RepID=A0A8I1JM57_PSEPU|nr:hypothetical protein [Pseudomonas putida]MBI6885145.1 hypothetical protein [Pseudomonas putida]